ncbi:MFS transporter [Actinomycetospora termitidis]|uniref:MFS transporter n=1 Tax=Actinomycetospora termitidis TaxID=3053470 RepID=A0ABT7MDU8_9PSEU|nr:MFS transporter [Actinomycetospora sp. Odt1-22]MDL5158843.1 MFS transporter [Actinomycetospora sp. Odt1-22]
MPVTALAFLASHFLSLLGNGIAAVALPLIVLQITGSPASVGLVSTATAGPALLVGLGAGLVLDRVNRRTCSVASDVISAGAVVAIPVVELVHGLDLAWLIALAVVGAFGDVPGMTARQVLAPALARHTGVGMERLIGLRQSMTSMALIIGPAAAGALLAVFDGTTVLLLTAATSATAALLTLAVPHRLGRIDDRPTERPSIASELMAGFRVLRRSRFLTGTVGLTLGLAVVIGGLQGLVLPVYFESVVRPDLLGLVLTALAVGMLAGTTVFAAVGSRLPRSVWIAVALLGTTAGLTSIATLVSAPVILAGAALLGVGNAVTGAVLGVLQAERTPEATRGRVLSLQNALLQVAAPAGVGLAGVVAEAGSPVAAGFSVVAVWIVVLVAVAGSGALRDLEPAVAAR